MRSHWSGGKSCNGPMGPAMPALLIRMSNRPRVDSTRAAACCTWCKTVTSQGMTSVFPPLSEIESAVRSRVDWVRPQRATVAPRAANWRATAAPMPRPAPVTTATCPARGGVVSIKGDAPRRESETSTLSAMRILAIKGRVNGKLLAFGGTGTYNPASREKGSPSQRSTRAPLLPEHCQEAQHSRAGSEQSRQNAVAAEVLENTFAKEQFPKR